MRRGRNRKNAYRSTQGKYSVVTGLLAISVLGSLTINGIGASESTERIFCFPVFRRWPCKGNTASAPLQIRKPTI